MQIQIDARKVSGVVKETNDMLLQHPFNPAEIIVGLSELIGRIIVQYGTTSIQMDELKEVVVNHINRTTSIGAHANGKGPLERA